MTKDWGCFEDICVNHGPCSRSSTRGIERYHKTEMVKLNLNYKRSANISIFYPCRIDVSVYHARCLVSKKGIYMEAALGF